MATRSFIADDQTAAIDRVPAGVGRILRYQLNVVASTTDDVVRSAGGWLCDRARGRAGMSTSWSLTAATLDHS
jgi:nitrate/nitrite transporter NarK